MTLTDDRAASTTAASTTEPETTPAPVHVLHVADGSGDTEITWTPGRAVEVDAARALFDKMRDRHRYLAYKIDDDGEMETIHQFDPELGKIVMMPQRVGG